MDLNEIVESVKEEVIKEEDALKEGIRDTQYKITDMGHKKIKDLMDELHDDLPVFEKAGYKLHSMEVEIGISPKLIPYFIVEKQISQEEQQAILDEVKHQRVLHLLLKSLFKSSYLKEVLKIGDLEFHGLRIELAAMPTVRLLFLGSGCDPEENEEI